MSSTPISVLVTLATGRQGAQVIKALSLHNTDGKKTFLILALTRNPTSTKSKALLSYPGVELIEGNISSDQAAEEVFTAAQSKVKAHGLDKLDGVFLAQLAIDNPEGLYHGEIKEAKRFVDLAIKHQVSHLVYSSIAGLLHDADTGVPFIESKRVIEKYIKDTTKSPFSTTTWTMLQPTGFMENLTKSEDDMQRFANTLVTGVITSPLQWVSCLDIGKFTARALLDRGKYAEKSIALAGECLSPHEVISKWEKAGLGEFKTLPVKPMLQQVQSIEPLAKLVEFLNSVGYQVDIPTLRRNYPDMLDLDSFLKTELV